MRDGEWMWVIRIGDVRSMVWQCCLVLLSALSALSALSLSLSLSLCSPAVSFLLP